MKKVKKRAQTVEIAPRADGDGDGAEVTLEAQVDGDADAADATAEDDTDAELEEVTDPGVVAAAVFDASEEPTPVSPVGSDGMPLAFSSLSPESWDGPTSEGDAAQLAALREASRVDGAPDEGATPDGAAADASGTEPQGAAADEVEAPGVDSAGRLESIIESLLFASDRVLGLPDLKRLLNERDGKAVLAAVERLQERHRETGVPLVAAGGGWQFRTHPDNAPWVSKLIAGRPARLSRAMLETLAIVAYRQPITRPEIDEIRGVDCGPVLKTLLDRALVRMIGKKEEVGRPILYGTTPEFLRTFSLRDLTELPTLREFHELGLAEKAEVEAKAPRPAGSSEDVSPEAAAAAAAAAFIPRAMPAPTRLPDVDPDEEDALLAELDDASNAAARAAKVPETPPGPTPGEPTPSASEGAE